MTLKNNKFVNINTPTIKTRILGSTTITDQGK